MPYTVFTAEQLAAGDRANARALALADQWEARRLQAREDGRPDPPTLHIGLAPRHGGLEYFPRRHIGPF